MACCGRPVESALEVHVGPRCPCLGLRAATPPQADTRSTASVIGALALALRAAGRRRLTHGRRISRLAWSRLCLGLCTARAATG